jgi:hypothetical protein
LKEGSDFSPYRLFGHGFELTTIRRKGSIYPGAPAFTLKSPKNNQD